MEFTEDRYQTLIHDPADDGGPPRRIPDVVHESRLTARIKLYEDEVVRDAWETLVKSFAVVTEEAYHLGEYGIPQASVEAAKEAIVALQDELRTRMPEGR